MLQPRQSQQSTQGCAVPGNRLLTKGLCPGPCLQSPPNAYVSPHQQYISNLDFPWQWDSISMMLAFNCWSVDKNCTTLPLWTCFSLFAVQHGAQRQRAEIPRALPDTAWCCRGAQAALGHSGSSGWWCSQCLSVLRLQSHLLGAVWCVTSIRTWTVLRGPCIQTRAAPCPPISAYNNTGTIWLCEDRPWYVILDPFFWKLDCLFCPAVYSAPSHQDQRHQPTSLLSWSVSRAASHCQSSAPAPQSYSVVGYWGKDDPGRDSGIWKAVWGRGNRAKAGSKPRRQTLKSTGILTYRARREGKWISAPRGGSLNLLWS